jgi:hypothetical protein
MLVFILLHHCLRPLFASYAAINLITMADQQPSWLAKESDSAPPSEPAAAPAAAVKTPDVAVSDRSAEPAAAASTTVDESDLSKMILFMRIANMGLAIAMLVCSVS